MKKILLASAIAAAFGMTVVAGAQQSTNSLGDVTPTNIDVRAGGVFSIDSTMRSISNFWFGLGVDYIFPTQYIHGTTMYLSFDWLTHTTNTGGGNVFPLCLNFKFPLSQEVKGYSTYGFLGAGAFFDNIATSATVVGIRGGIGVNLGPNIFTEATLYFSSGDNSYHTNAFGLYLGYRF